MQPDPTAEHLDVVIVGAGLSGIDAAYRLQTDCPGKRYAILEARDAIGGTWDLFRYPGIRSDSDMYTLGFPFQPWPGDSAIAEGGAIRDYIADTAREFGIDRHIRFATRVIAGVVVVRRCPLDGEVERRRRDRAGSPAPSLHGQRLLRLRRRLHARLRRHRRLRRRGGPSAAWPQELDWRGKRVVVIGSGATAVTLVPALADKAAHVTMLQRSPTYIVVAPVAGPIRRARASPAARPARAASPPSGRAWVSASPATLMPGAGPTG